MGCPSDPDSDSDSETGSGSSGLAATLQKYKWMSGDNPEFNEYDTWLEFTDDVFVYYFVSDTEGVLRQHHKWIDSYREGSQGHDIYNTYFDYKVNGNTVTIRFIDSYAPNVTFTYDGKTLRSQDNGVLTPVVPSSGDRALVKALFPQTGKTGECTYTYDPRTKEMVISGNGTMGDYAAGKQPWAEFPMEEVTIEDGVTAIGNHAFYNIYTLQKVWISSKSNLRSIGVEAFAKSPITSITIPSKVEIIKEAAFSGCNKLGLIDFSKSTSLKTIENYAFSGVEKWQKTPTGNYSGKQYYYKTLEVPATVESMGMVAFNGDIEEIVIGKNMRQMAWFAISTSVNNGKMYVNRGTPPTVNSSVLGERESSWTLYVPKGCKSAYQKDEAWKKFYKIIEDENLEKGDDYTGGSGDDNPSGGDDNPSGGDDNPSGGDNPSSKDYNQTFTYNGVTYTMILVEGCPTGDFYIMDKEIPGTAFDRDNSGEFDYSEFRASIQELRKLCGGMPLRVPCVDEWLYAARGGNKSKGYKYSGSDDIDDVAWYSGNSSHKPHASGLKKPNELGIYDMSGNWAEICIADFSNYEKAGDSNYYGWWDYVCGGSCDIAANACQVTSKKAAITTGEWENCIIVYDSTKDLGHIGIRLVYTKGH